MIKSNMAKFKAVFLRFLAKEENNHNSVKSKKAWNDGILGH